MDNFAIDNVLYYFYVKYLLSKIQTQINVAFVNFEIPLFRTISNLCWYKFKVLKRSDKVNAITSRYMWHSGQYLGLSRLSVRQESTGSTSGMKDNLNTTFMYDPIGEGSVGTPKISLYSPH